MISRTKPPESRQVNGWQEEEPLFESPPPPRLRTKEKPKSKAPGGAATKFKPTRSRSSKSMSPSRGTRSAPPPQSLKLKQAEAADDLSGRKPVQVVAPTRSSGQKPASVGASAHSRPRQRTAPPPRPQPSATPSGGQDLKGRVQAPASTPSKAAPEPQPTPAQVAAHRAKVIKEGIFPAQMSSTLRLGSIDANAFRAFLEQLFRESGSPTDPVERMLLEQIALAHFRLGELYVTAAGAAGNEAIKIMNAATARLLSEFRRTALAVSSYRAKEQQRKLPPVRTSTKK